MTSKTDIWVYAHWLGMSDPKLIGVLSAQQTKTRKSFSFSYERAWLHSSAQMLLDPDIQWYTGPQHPVEKQNFGAFLDSMPDTWGRTLMKRRAAADAKVSGIHARTLYDIDFLLGVFDESRMGGLRFKLHPDGSFLDNNQDFPIPVWSDLSVLQLNQLEQEVIIKEVKSACIKWREVADELSISRADQEMMAAAFRLIN